ncbi:hypothetical protein FACS1894166_10470 [Bacilli bacterium]|nr:hypothetical protein FACS1894166_10470 [Bacilli bacterium]
MSKIKVDVTLTQIMTVSKIVEAKDLQSATANVLSTIKSGE